jgi:hypothetical protein
VPENIMPIPSQFTVSEEKSTAFLIFFPSVNKVLSCGYFKTFSLFPIFRIVIITYLDIIFCSLILLKLFSASQLYSYMSFDKHGGGDH